MARVENLARSVQGVQGIHELRAEDIGPETVAAGIYIEVPRGISIEEADRIAHQVREPIQEAMGCRYCTIHTDPMKIEASSVDTKTAGQAETAEGPITRDSDP